MTFGGFPARRRRSASLAPLLLSAAIAACGGGDGDTFTAEELVSEVNEHQGGLVLGPPLTTTQEDVEIYTLTFAGSPRSEAGAPPGGGQPATDVHGGGSLTITADADAGFAEYERCEAAASLICFRVANAVLAFEGSVVPDDLDRLEAAIRALGD